MSSWLWAATLPGPSLAHWGDVAWPGSTQDAEGGICHRRHRRVCPAHRGPHLLLPLCQHPWKLPVQLPPNRIQAGPQWPQLPR